MDVCASLPALWHASMQLIACSLLLSCADTPYRDELHNFMQQSLEMLQPVVCTAVERAICYQASHTYTVMLPALRKLAEELGPEYKANLASGLWQACK